MSTMTLEEQVKSLKAELSSIWEELYDHRVDGIQQSLKPASFSEVAELQDLESYRHWLDNHRGTNDTSFQQMRGEELESFKGCQEYRQWIESPSASLLVLSAYNNPSLSDDSGVCWMSRLGLNLIEELRQNDETVAIDSDNASDSIIYAFYRVPHLWPKLPDDFFSKLLPQLLRKKPRALRDKKEYNKLRAQLDTFYTKPFTTHGVKMADFKADIMKKIALRIISLFDESDTVYIIVDSADYHPIGNRPKLDHRKGLIRLFAEMVQSARAKLRILVVVNGRQWEVQGDEIDFGIEMKDRVIIHRVEQARVDSE